MKRNF